MTSKSQRRETAKRIGIRQSQRPGQKGHERAIQLRAVMLRSAGVLVELLEF